MYDTESICDKVLSFVGDIETYCRTLGIEPNEELLGYLNDFSDTHKVRCTKYGGGVDRIASIILATHWSITHTNSVLVCVGYTQQEFADWLLCVRQLVHGEDVDPNIRELFAFNKEGWGIVHNYTRQWGCHAVFGYTGHQLCGYHSNYFGILQNSKRDFTRTSDVVNELLCNIYDGHSIHIIV